MTPDREWDDIRGRPAPLLGVAGMGMLRFALLFGSAAAALALILAPMADRYSKSAIANIDAIDYMATGSVRPSGAYVIHRSVLQKPGAVCIIHANGDYKGDC